MNKIRGFFATLFLFMSLQGHADPLSPGEVLTIDEPVPESVSLEFSDSSELQAKLGEFRIVSTILMSNKHGERWATLTIKNTASGQRLLDREHIVALFANGERRNPEAVEQKFGSQEEISTVVSFGKSKFPIIRIMTRN